MLVRSPAGLKFFRAVPLSSPPAIHNTALPPRSVRWSPPLTSLFETMAETPGQTVEQKLSDKLWDLIDTPTKKISEQAVRKGLLLFLVDCHNGQLAA